MRMGARVSIVALVPPVLFTQLRPECGQLYLAEGVMPTRVRRRRRRHRRPSCAAEGPSPNRCQGAHTRRGRGRRKVRPKGSILTKGLHRQGWRLPLTMRLLASWLANTLAVGAAAAAAEREACCR